MTPTFCPLNVLEVQEANSVRSEIGGGGGHLSSNLSTISLTVFLCHDRDNCLRLLPARVKPLTDVGAPVTGSDPLMSEKPSIWSNERFSNMRTKTCWIPFGKYPPACPQRTQLRLLTLSLRPPLPHWLRPEPRSRCQDHCPANEKIPMGLRKANEAISAMEMEDTAHQ